MIQVGSFSKNHHVWKNGMTDWILASDMQELSNLFSSVPPPPPSK
jgi:hypothetical protein